MFLSGSNFWPNPANPDMIQAGSGDALVHAEYLLCRPGFNLSSCDKSAWHCLALRSTVSMRTSGTRILRYRPEVRLGQARRTPRERSGKDLVVELASAWLVIALVSSLGHSRFSAEIGAISRARGSAKPSVLTEGPPIACRTFGGRCDRPRERTLASLDHDRRFRGALEELGLAAASGADRDGGRFPADQRSITGHAGRGNGPSRPAPWRNLLSSAASTSIRDRGHRSRSSYASFPFSSNLGRETPPGGELEADFHQGSCASPEADASNASVSVDTA